MSELSGNTQKSLEFRLLGPLEVVADGRQLPVSSPRQRVVLAMLLLAPDCVVSVDTLVEAIWDDDPPVTRRTQIAICVTALRKMFAAAGFPNVISTVSPGYKLNSAGCRIDHEEFARLTGQAQSALREGRTSVAGALLEQALKLWRGDALAGVPSGILAAKALQLEERRLTATEECLARKAELGRHTDLVPELAALVREHPLRERARAALMLAHYRVGGRREALEVFNEGRRRLVDELGLEPGPILRDMQAAILNDDPGLSEGGAKPATTVWTGLVPAQLPPAPPYFAGRKAELDALDGLLELRGRGGLPAVGVLTGMAGVGKTALALQWAHRAAEYFPDGRLFADLRGWDSDYLAAEPSAVLSRLLRDLGVAPSEIPARVDEQVPLYNSLLDGRQTLLLLDNVRSAAQVRPLVPGSGSCCVIITGRSLPDAYGSVQAHVTPLGTADSADLLRNLMGAEQRAGEEPGALERVAELCDHLPLALWGAAMRLGSRGHWTPKDLIGRLERRGGRLGEISHGVWDMRERIALSYRELRPGPAMALHRLGGLDFPEVTPWRAARLFGCGPEEAEDLLEELREAGFLVLSTAGDEPLYRTPGLFAEYAQEKGHYVYADVPRPVEVRG
ncbi:BTAD domain-containing putative transcriptional regulator [Nonomuraea sp. NPDC050786]|uniref:AfsR/SARP family transcriptional regulator n=1 Tax=Nonomuraea sp. NPDC050786 TaxID=3154840 RepID=UPI0033D8CB56